MTSTLTPRARGQHLLPALTITPILRGTVAVHAVADDQPWRSACMCGRPMWPDAVRPSGRCAGYGERAGAPPYAVEAAAVLAAVALASSGRGGWEVAAFAWWPAGMIVLAFVDLAVLRLPHRLTARTSAGLLPLLAATGDTGAFLRAVTAAAVLAMTGTRRTGTRASRS